MTDDKVRFLVVDDLEGNIAAITGLLAREGLEVISARSGAEARSSRKTSRRRLLRITSTVLPSWPKTPSGRVIAFIRVATTRTRMTPSAKARF